MNCRYIRCNAWAEPRRHAYIYIYTQILLKFWNDRSLGASGRRCLQGRRFGWRSPGLEYLDGSSLCFHVYAVSVPAFLNVNLLDVMFWWWDSGEANWRWMFMETHAAWQGVWKKNNELLAMTPWAAFSDLIRRWVNFWDGIWIWKIFVRLI